MRTLIRNCMAVLPSGTVQTNVLLDGSRIASLEASEHAAADRVIDATGLHLIPGVIDDHVHFREPGATHKEDLASGSRSAAMGGVTSFLEMPNTTPETTNQAVLDEKLTLAKAKSRVNYGFYVGATPDNLESLKHAVRTPGIKIFVGCSTGNLLVSDQPSLERIYAETTLPICVHAEDQDVMHENEHRIGPTSDVRDHSRIRDHRVSAVSAARMADLATRHKHPTHILHVSSRTEIEFFDSPYVSAEACIHHLLMNTSDYERYGNFVKMNPSLKEAEDNAALWQALKDGKIDVVATDHAPHTILEKGIPFPGAPSGIPGVQTLLPLMLNEVHTGRITLEQAVQWLCTNPARIWSLKGKGALVEGYDADVVLVDMKETRTIRHEDQLSKCGWTPWHGRMTTGWPTHTFVMGQLVMERGRIDESVRGQELEVAFVR